MGKRKQNEILKLPEKLSSTFTKDDCLEFCKNAKNQESCDIFTTMYAKVFHGDWSFEDYQNMRIGLLAIKSNVFAANFLTILAMLDLPKEVLMDAICKFLPPSKDREEKIQSGKINFQNLGEVINYIEAIQMSVAQRSCLYGIDSRKGYSSDLVKEVNARLQELEQFQKTGECAADSYIARAYRTYDDLTKEYQNGGIFAPIVEQQRGIISKGLKSSLCIHCGRKFDQSQREISSGCSDSHRRGPFYPTNHKKRLTFGEY